MDFAPVVVDNGSGTIKAGHAGDEDPRSITPTITGKPRDANQMIGMDQKELFIGVECLSDDRRGMLNLNYPIDENGINDWDIMEEIWKGIFYDGLNIKPENFKFFMTEPPQTPKKNREKMAEIIFEKMNAQEFYVGITSVCALYAFGKTTGVVLDAGHSVTHAVPIYEGFALPHAINKVEMGGKHLTQHLYEEIVKRQPNIDKALLDTKSVSILKEKNCFVALDYDAKIKESGKQEIVSLPDKNKIVLGNLKFFIPEILFQPTVIGSTNAGIHEKIYKSIMKCTQDIRRNLYMNIILAGGTTMFPKMKERLKKEIVALAPSTMNVDPQAPAERKFSVWIGGSIVASLDSFEDMWVKRSEWEEDGGRSMVHIKCF